MILDLTGIANSHQQDGSEDGDYAFQGLAMVTTRRRTTRTTRNPHEDEGKS
jgi:hypothetical protein